MDITQEYKSSTDLHFPLFVMALCFVKRRLTATTPPPGLDLHQPSAPHCQSPFQLFYEPPAFLSR